MYNEELKKKFIREYTTSTSTANVCETIFNAFQKSEEEWGADLCTRNEEELQPVVNMAVGLRSRSKWMRLIVLKDYVQWCIGTNVAGACDGMLKITDVGLDKVRQQTIANPKHLQNYLDAICEPAEKCTTDNIYRCYYWLAYAGVEEEDILNIKCSDVDFRNMVVNYPQKLTSVPIYPEALQAFHNCVELTQFVYSHPNYTKTVWKDRAEGDTLIRGLRALPTLKAIRVELSRRSKNKSDKTDLKLSYFRVWISGLFNRMYENERAGIQPDFNSIVLQQMEGKTYNLSSGRNTIEAKQRQLVRDYEDDYQRWKLAWIYRNAN